ncbi:hypothetical protein [Streptomyces flavofungini]|uniref:hypothetical protein n=1 Tax=Streptomyces flavofungini TaxID=68200 RepID=UPI0025B082AA|nr:hypothetical protein [Streptomyces flavofungini]WJV44106.1 hypothetical protein QUY26_00225 [Streptomyces flavofungini]
MALLRSGLAELDGESADGLTDHFPVFDKPLVRAHARVLRPLADHGEPSYLPEPAQ